VAQFVERGRGGIAVLVLQGEAGIGKTTVWAAGVDAAREQGFRVLVTRPVEAEAGLAFTGLADIVADVLDEVALGLPAPQLKALRVALLLDEADGAPPDERAVGAALRSVLSEVARCGPTLLAIDDVQWLDGASARALAFALRRVREAPLGILLAQRSPPDAEPPLGLGRAGVEVEQVAIGALDAEAMHDVVVRSRGTSLPRAMLRRVHEVSGGNPFFAIELARSLEADRDWERGALLPIPTSLRELVRSRLAAVSGADVLALVAALPQPTAAMVRGLAGSGADAGIETAVDAGILRREGDRLRFTHPLLASAAYAAMSPPQRRALHGRLAEATEDPLERGHHLAHATEVADGGVAAELDDAVSAALQRGALQTAADLGAHARRLTPENDSGEARRRAVNEAECRHLLGQPARARAILDEELGRCPPGAARAPLLYELGRVELWGVDWHGSGEHLRAALGEMHESDHALRAQTELQLAQMFLLIGDEPRSIAEHASRAAASAQAVGNDAVLAEALALRGRAEAQLGMDATAVIDRALALESTTVALSTIDQPSDNLAEVRDWHDDLGGALTTLRRVVRDAEQRGEDASVAWTLGRTAMLLCALGEPDAALRDAERAYEFTAESQRPENEAVMLGVIASIEAYRGDDARARLAGARALEVTRTSGIGRPDRLVRSALGMLELSLGDVQAAHRQLEPLVARTRAAAIGEPGAMRFVTDDVEALIGIGDLESAGELLGWYEGCAQRLDRQSALASSARCRGLLASGRGDAEAAWALLADSIERGGDVALPLDRARTMMALGVVERRLQRKRAARETLEEAHSAFEGIGARLWAQRVRDELQRIGGRRTEGGELTASERRVAELVSQGLSNREVASALFVSAKTVEFHLRNIFRKLGVRSRTELARRI
jgi:DNA-binding CsgD family transcriptional regulator